MGQLLVGLAMRFNNKLWSAYKLRWKRRKLLFRAIRKRHELNAIANRTKFIKPGSILAVSTVRNEIIRLPYFLQHHRQLGVDHFLFVDNNSDDGTLEFLSNQPDVSVWSTSYSYKESRFGVDWLTWLQIKYAHGHWCLTLDADEQFIYPHWGKRSLQVLTKWLEANNTSSMAALMLDMYPKGPLSRTKYTPGTDPFKTLKWFDCGNYTWVRQEKYHNISIRGGVRKRKFFANAPELAPHLHKTPLVKWHRSFVYVSSSHIVLPHYLNKGFDIRNAVPTGILMHSKFLNDILDNTVNEKLRREHFTHADCYNNYYDQINSDPNLWCTDSVCFSDWHQIEEFGLMTRGKWQ